MSETKDKKAEDQAAPRSAEGRLEQRSLVATIGLVAGVLGLTAIVFGLVLYVINPSASIISVINLVFAAAALVFYLISNWASIRRVASGRSTPLVMLEVLLMSGVVLAAVAANYFAAQSKKEWDFTRDELFSLQEQSVKVASGLKKPVKIIGFFKPQEGVRNTLGDLVELYQKHTDLIEVEFMNPDAIPPAVAKQYKLSPSSPRIVVTAGDDRQTKIKTPSEQELTNALIKVAERPPRKACFLTGHAEPSIEDEKGELGYQRAAQLLSDQGFDLGTVSLIDRENVPAECTVLLVAGAQKTLFPNEAESLNAFLRGGGRLALLVDPGLDHGLDRILTPWGINIGDNLVVDTSPAARASGFGLDAPVVTKFEQHPITNSLKGSAVLFYWARSVTPGIGSGNATLTTLILTSEASWGESKYKDGGDVSRDEEDLAGPVPVAVAGKKTTVAVPDRRTDEARIVVIGDSSFASNKFVTTGGNSDLFLNVVSWLAGEEQQIAIRPKMRSGNRIPLTLEQLYAIYFFSTNLLPLLIVGFGFSVWAVRRRM